MELINIFRDPLNVTALVEGKRGTKGVEEYCTNVRFLTSLVSTIGAFLIEKGISFKKPRCNTILPRFSLLLERPDGRNQIYILIAIMFLVRKFEGLVHDLPVMTKKETYRPCRDGFLFRHWAYKLELQEPVLQGVSGEAYWSMYDRLLKNYADYKRVSEDFKEECLFEPTHLFKWVRRLSEVNEVYFDYAFTKDEFQSGIHKAGEKERPAQSRQRPPSADRGATATLAGGSAKWRKTNNSVERPGSSLPTEVIHITDDD